MSWYVPPMSLLRGLSVREASCFGMPNLGAHYEGRSVRSNRLDDDARCAVCGRPATNAHHVPPVGMGARNAKFELHGHVLRPALIALCGSGTTGCHGEVHSGRILVEWEWCAEEYEVAWWQGLLLEMFGPASPRLYEFGRWTFEWRDAEIPPLR